LGNTGGSRGYEKKNILGGMKKKFLWEVKNISQSGGIFWGEKNFNVNLRKKIQVEKVPFHMPIWNVMFQANL
jgi:hypothetical protein